MGRSRVTGLRLESEEASRLNPIMHVLVVALAVGLVPSFPSFSQDAAVTATSDLLIQGRTKAQAGLFTEAEGLIFQAITKSPNDAQGYCALGVLQYNRGKYDAAIQSLTRTLALDWKLATAHAYLGLTAREKGWSQAVEKELETASEIWKADRIASTSSGSTSSTRSSVLGAEGSTRAKGIR